MGGTNGLGQWRCRQCASAKVTDRLLSIVAEKTEVRRLICSGCGAVSHYDRTGTSQPTKSLNNQFWWIE